MYETKQHQAKPHPSKTETTNLNKLVYNHTKFLNSSNVGPSRA